MLIQLGMVRAKTIKKKSNPSRTANNIHTKEAYAEVS